MVLKNRSNEIPCILYSDSTNVRKTILQEKPRKSLMDAQFINSTTQVTNIRIWVLFFRLFLFPICICITAAQL